MEIKKEGIDSSALSGGGTAAPTQEFTSSVQLPRVPVPTPIETETKLILLREKAYEGDDELWKDKEEGDGKKNSSSS
jgi:hypothetical protein